MSIPTVTHDHLGMDNIGQPVYAPWHTPVPLNPLVWFPEEFCIDLASWGQCTLFPDPDPRDHERFCGRWYSLYPTTDPGEFGRWTYHFDTPEHPWHARAEGNPYRWLKDQLPGTRLKWENWDTHASGLWVLTDTVVTAPLGAPSGGKYDLRLGRWPD